jgi:hypothetical protein
MNDNKIREVIKNMYKMRDEILKSEQIPWGDQWKLFKQIDDEIMSLIKILISKTEGHLKISAYTHGNGYYYMDLLKKDEEGNIHKLSSLEFYEKKDAVELKKLLNQYLELISNEKEQTNE